MSLPIEKCHYKPAHRSHSWGSPLRLCDGVKPAVDLGQKQYVVTEAEARGESTLQPDDLVKQDRRATDKPWTRDQYLSFFKETTDRMYETTKRKNHDYGGAEDPFKNFREFGVMGILVRISDKWARIKTALKEKRTLQVLDETVEDTLLDLAVYCILCVAWLRGSGEKN